MTHRSGPFVPAVNLPALQRRRTWLWSRRFGIVHSRIRQASNKALTIFDRLTTSDALRGDSLLAITCPWLAYGDSFGKPANARD